MRTFNRYIINPKTEVIYPELDNYGYVYSIFSEGKTISKVHKKSSELMDQSLQHYGYNLKGAIAGAKSILGKVKYCPIIVCSQLDLYWFPCKSEVPYENIWIAQHHVIESKQISKNKTEVFFTSGNSITVEMSKLTFDNRLTRTIKLRHDYIERITHPEKANRELITGYLICRNPVKNNTRMTISKEK